MALKIGDPAPDFTLPDQDGRPVRLSDLRGRQVIVYFYPKDDTPGCTTQACGFRDAFPRITDANALVLGISPDDAKSHVRFRAKQNLPFTLLSDVDHAVAELYGVWGERSMYGRTFMGIVRSHFVIDPNGILSDVQVKVSPKDSVASALATVTGS
ncbi:MAG TPA: thioredoxin-dependent thiol peroxidase [Anaerolineales bacterium]|nr:thioredoxin-dependent thiol peroxidase [Anaerolineales bacterium]HRF49938.1 thioredoxin-dependent thiol peroxidase [Anaerolineales bacterium]